MGINQEVGSSGEIVRLRDHLAAVQERISLSQLVALLTIAAKPGLSVNELADNLNVPQQTASRHVAILTGRYQNQIGQKEVEQFVEQVINQSDPRKRSLFLTPAGEELIENVLK